MMLSKNSPSLAVPSKKGKISMIQSCVCATSRNSVSKLRPCNDKCHAGDILNDNRLTNHTAHREKQCAQKQKRQRGRGVRAVKVTIQIRNTPAQLNGDPNQSSRIFAADYCPAAHHQGMHQAASAAYPHLFELS